MVAPEAEPPNAWPLSLERRLRFEAVQTIRRLSAAAAVSQQSSARRGRGGSWELAQDGCEVWRRTVPCICTRDLAGCVA